MERNARQNEFRNCRWYSAARTLPQLRVTDRRRNYYSWGGKPNVLYCMPHYKFHVSPTRRPHMAHNLTNADGREFLLTLSRWPSPKRARWTARKMGAPQYEQALAARVATDHMDGRVVVRGEGDAGHARRRQDVSGKDGNRGRIRALRPSLCRAPKFTGKIYKIPSAAAPLAPSQLLAPRAGRCCVRERVWAGLPASVPSPARPLPPSMAKRVRRCWSGLFRVFSFLFTVFVLLLSPRQHVRTYCFPHTSNAAVSYYRHWTPCTVY